MVRLTAISTWLLATCVLSIAWGTSRAADLVVVQIAPGIWLYEGAQEDASSANRGHIANLGFIIGSQRVAVIDTGGSLQEGLALRAAIRRVTDLPIAYVILTHIHPDHILGAAAFEQDRPEFIGHVNLPDALARRGEYDLARAVERLGDAMAGTRLVVPKATVATARTLDLGGRVLELRAHPTAHTNNDLSIFDSQTGTLWLSDLLFVERIPALDGSLLGWLRVMEEIQGVEAQRVVPGHGPVPADWHAALAAQYRYLETIAEGVRELIRRHVTIEEAVTRVGRAEAGRWLLFEDYHGRNVTAAFVELEWE